MDQLAAGCRGSRSAGLVPLCEGLVVVAAVIVGELRWIGSTEDAAVGVSPLDWFRDVKPLLLLLLYK